MGKLQKFWLNYREDALLVSVLTLLFLVLYLLVAAYLINTFKVDHLTSPATPPACDPPNARLRIAQRSKTNGPLSLCT
jgi:hypothetical protein